MTIKQHSLLTKNVMQAVLVHLVRCCLLNIWNIEFNISDLPSCLSLLAATPVVLGL